MPTKTKKTEENSVKVQEETLFSKGQLLTCAKYAKRKDLVNSLLEEGYSYTFTEVDEKINAFLEGDFTERKGE